MKISRTCCTLIFVSLLASLPSFAQDAPSREWFELRGGMPNSKEVFETTKKGTVAFVGGSITEMNGWRNLVIEELQKRFPETEFEFISAGISSTGSTPGAFRLTTDVFAQGKKVDLLFEEAAVNDYTNFRTPTEMLRGMEGIVRRTKTLNPNADVVVMYFAEPAKCRDYRAGIVPEVIVQHERVAEHYAIPSINLAKEVTDRIDAGEFSWEKDFRDLHPAPFGHELYCRTICRLFDAAWPNASEQQTSAAESVSTAALPEPLDPFSYFDGHYVSIREAEGWRLVENWTPTLRVGVRRGFVNTPMLESSVPGETLSFRFNGRAVGIFAIAGPDTGIVEYSVDGREWKQKDFFTPWSTQLYLPWAQIFEAELDEGPHVLRLRMASEKNPKSVGNALRIVHFLVNGPDSSEAQRE
ncbi:MAG: SGNH/GDSL hydrolase family protein [Planctomycetia bacterium]|nr:SGNH/GDSL hydrolase family protein [Planctomycetia bacterium]